MKQLSILCLFVLCAIKLNAQQPSVEILTGKPLDYVKKYYNTLKERVSQTNNYLISEKTNVNGYLILTFETPTNKETTTNSSAILAEFIRLDNKQEICVRQTIVGTELSAYVNLTPIKDSFKSLGKGEWIKQNAPNSDWNTIATYNLEGKTYTLQISLEPKQTNKK